MGGSGIRFKIDAVPGRLNQILSFITRPGVFYGHVANYVGQVMDLCPLSLQALNILRIFMSKINNIKVCCQQGIN